MQRFTFGVVIPVFNRTEALHAALRSVLDQTRLPDEIVVVDDASDVPVELDGALGSHPLISVIRLDANSGAAAARQRGVDHLTTTHVAFLDSDDTWLPEKLARQEQALARLGGDEDVALSCAWRFKRDDRSLGPWLLPAATSSLNDFASGCWSCPGSTMLLSRSAIARAGGFDTSLRRLEDYDFLIRFALAGGRLDVVPFGGALIKRGRNATGGDVDVAVARIRNKFLDAAAPRLGSDAARRMRAWLEIERAVAARNEVRAVPFALHLLRSFLLVPRMRVQLGDWLKRLPEGSQDHSATSTASPNSL